MAMGPTDRQVEAQQDVERVAKALFELAQGPQLWRSAGEDTKNRWRGYVEVLLHRDLIRVGRRPNVERPMEGQTSIEDHLTDADKAVGADGK